MMLDAASILPYSEHPVSLGANFPLYHGSEFADAQPKTVKRIIAQFTELDELVLTYNKDLAMIPE